MQIKELKYAIFATHQACNSQIDGPYQNLLGLDRGLPESQPNLLEYATEASKAASVHSVSSSASLYKSLSGSGDEIRSTKRRGDERERPTLAKVLLALTPGT
jgi:hypothetical protein